MSFTYTDIGILVFQIPYKIKINKMLNKITLYYSTQVTFLTIKSLCKMHKTLVA